METKTKIIGVVASALLVTGIAATTSNDSGPTHRAVASSLPTPNHLLTPGAVDPAATLTVVCTTSTKGRRNTSAATKAEVYREYNAKHLVAGDFEVDHLIPLELGGADTLRNLWPEPAPSFHQKDQLENRLHALVCSPTNPLPLATAQKAIQTDWVRAYHTYVAK